MMGSAQLDLAPEPESDGGVFELSEAPRPSALRQQAAERLAAHRQRRGRAEAASAEEALQPKGKASPKHRVAAAVAERYAQTPSYRAFLAEQARRAVEEAAAAAEVAVRNAEAVAAAQQELLGELELWNAPQAFTAETAITIENPAAIKTAEPVEPARVQEAREPLPLHREPGLTVRLYEDLRQVPPAPVAEAWVPADAEETQALDAEIAFRQAPVFEDYWLEEEPPVPLPANLLEFPRQLVAARRARPRLAEGPLREEVTPPTAQLRIFEVEPEQISTAPAALEPAADWSAIHLEAHSVIETAVETEASANLAPMPAPNAAPQTAPLELRLMSGLVDGILVAGGALAFVAAYLHAGGELLLGWPAAAAALGLLFVTHVLYQLLFFTLSDQTPGMRYAQIGLCTFSDDNPTRAAMRRRILAQLVAVCPLGLGLLWIVLDDDGLGWHDRISRMYQRAY